MLRILAATVVLVGVALTGCLQAESQSSFKLGDPAPSFKDLPATDGNNYSLRDFKQDVLVLCITCNHCPVAAAYEERIINFTKRYATGPNAKVAFVAVSISDMDVDNLDKMKVRAKASGFNFPYLHDQSQRLGKELNAHVTPEFYVFDKNRKLAYWGAMDDDMDVSKTKEHYLVPAVEAVLAGKTVPNAQTKAFGCPVEFRK
jgi:peroxiredoxin